MALGEYRWTAIDIVNVWARLMERLSRFVSVRPSARVCIFHSPPIGGSAERPLTSTPRSPLPLDLALKRTECSLPGRALPWRHDLDSAMQPARAERCPEVKTECTRRPADSGRLASSFSRSSRSLTSSRAWVASKQSGSLAPEAIWNLDLGRVSDFRLPTRRTSVRFGQGCLHPLFQSPTPATLPTEANIGPTP
jgi:hypothetical protein